MWNDLPQAWQIVVSIALVVGGLFVLVGAIGLVRFDDFFMRLHSPTKATTLGVGSMLLASIVAGAGHDHWSASEVLVGLFLFITAPVSASLMAKAALHLRGPSRAERASRDAMAGSSDPGELEASNEDQFIRD
jgi:multicomponent K+:H+ antiporter subunit G